MIPLYSFLSGRNHRYILEGSLREQFTLGIGDGIQSYGRTAVLEEEGVHSHEDATRC